MAQTTIQLPGNNSTIRDGIRYTRVRVKSDWSEAWTDADYLEPLWAVEAAAPSISRAQFRYNYGRIKREDALAFADAGLHRLQGMYVMVEGLPNGGQPVPLWVGVITSEQLSMHAPDAATRAASGDQLLNAVGLEYFLYRRTMHGSVARQAVRDGVGEQEDPTDGAPTTVRIGRTLTFNAAEHGGLTVKGNRSTAKVPVPDPGPKGPFESYVFSRDGEVWNARQIMDYLRAWFPPPGPKFAPYGQHDALEQFSPVFDYDNLTIAEALNRLIDRRRGLGWCIRTSGVPDESVLIHVFSIFGEDIKVRDIDLPGNREHVRFDFETSIDLQRAMVSLDETQRYGRVTVRGERVLSCFSISYRDGTLVKAWSDEAEERYKLGVGVGDAQGQDAVANDEMRRTDEFAGVYASFMIPPNFNWLVGRGIGTETVGDDGKRVKVAFDFANPSFTGAGDWINRNVDLDEETCTADGHDDDWDPELQTCRRKSVDTNYFNWDMTIERFIPFTAEDRISGATPAGRSEYRAPFILVKTLDDQEQPTWHYIDSLGHLGLTSCHVSILDREPGLVVKGPPHFLGLNHFNAEDNFSAIQPELDWQDIIATVAVRTDTHLTVTTRLSTDSDKELLINVPGAEFWWCPRGTVIGVETTTEDGETFEHGKLVHFDPDDDDLDGRVLRDDSGELRAVAALASHWYGKRRAKASIQLEGITLYAPVGSYLTDIAAGANHAPVNAVVTSRTYDFANRTTTIRADWDELDPVMLVRAVGRGGAR